MPRITDFSICFNIFVFAFSFASRLDVTRIAHSGGHPEPWQHPTHHQNVHRKKGNEPEPVRHKRISSFSTNPNPTILSMSDQPDVDLKKIFGF
jgi:hypothetical protein